MNYLLDCTCSKTTCELWNTCPRLQTEVWAEDTRPLDLLIVGEWPNKGDVENGRPFTGDIGKLLWTFVNEHFPRDLSYGVTNVVRFAPKRNPHNGQIISPSTEQCYMCMDCLWHDIDILQPKRILLLGQLAVEMLTGRDYVGATRGRPLVVQTPSGKSIPAGSTYHPSLCIGNGNHLSILAEDARRLWTGFSDIYAIPPKEEHKYTLLTDIKQIGEFFEWLWKGQTKQTVVCCDFEGQNLNKFANNAVFTTQWTVDGKMAYVIPYKHPESPFAHDQQALDYLKQWHNLIFGSNPDQVSFGYFCGHNLQFENIQSLREFGTYWRSAPNLDTMAGIFLLDENLTDFYGDAYEGSMGLKWAVEYWGGFMGYHTPRMKIAMDYRNTGTLNLLDLDNLAEYGGLDVTANWHLLFALAQSAATQPNNYTPHWWNSMIYQMSQGIKFFSNVTYNGFWLDQEYNAELQKDKGLLQTELDAINASLRASPHVRKLNEQILEEMTGGMPALFDEDEEDGDDWVVDINRPDQQQRLFFDIMGLKPISMTKTGKPQVNVDFQDAYGKPDSPNLKELHPEVEAFVALQAAKKMRGTYITKLANYMQEPDGSDGRIRPEFGITKTVTGRTNSRNPNFQQIPRGQTELRQAIRRQFACSPGRVLVSLDYCANEIRWFGQESGDPNLCQTFWKAREALFQFRANPTDKAAEKLYKSLADIHRNTASLMYGVPVDEVTKQMRQDAKTLSFGLPYGRSMGSMAYQVGCTEAEMVEKSDKFFEPFSVMKDWIAEIAVLAGQQGYVEDTFHKRRRLMSTRTGIRSMVGSGGRQACNSPIQHAASTAAFIANTLYFEDYIWPQHRYDWWVVNSVHDSETSDIPVYDIKEFILAGEPYYTEGISKYIEDHFGSHMKIPIQVEFECGFNLAQKITWDYSPGHLDEIQQFFIWWDKCQDRRADPKKILLKWEGPMGDKARAELEEKKRKEAEKAANKVA